MFELLERTALDTGGWRFPFVRSRGEQGSPNETRYRDKDWIGQCHHWDSHREALRFYTSGQFALLTSVPWDWRDESGWSPIKPGEDWKPNAKIGFGHIAQMVVQTLVFTGRLAETVAGDEIMHFELGLAPTDGRELFSDFSRRMLSPFYKADINRIDIVRDIPRVELLGRAPDLNPSLIRQTFGN